MIPSVRQIVAARSLLGLSQAQLAERAGINVSQVRRFETQKSKPTIGTMQAMLDVFLSEGIEFTGETDRQWEGIVRLKKKRGRAKRSGK